MDPLVCFLLVALDLPVPPVGFTTSVQLGPYGTLPYRSIPASASYIDPFAPAGSLWAPHHIGPETRPIVLRQSTRIAGSIQLQPMLSPCGPLGPFGMPTR